MTPSRAVRGHRRAEQGHKPWKSSASRPGLLRPAAAGPDQRVVLRLLSLGLAVIFGLLNIINFAHGAQYMLGAFAAWMG